eukprot:787202_1
MSTLCRPIFVFTLIVTHGIINAQPGELFYSFGFEQPSDWEENNRTAPTHLYVPILQHTDDTACPQASTSDTSCGHLSRDSFLSRIMPTIDVHAVGIETAYHEWWFKQYRTEVIDWENVNVVQSEGHYQRDFVVPIPDTRSYNDQESFEVKLSVNANQGPDNCYYFDNLRIFGIPYPQNPTNYLDGASMEMPYYDVLSFILSAYLTNIASLSHCILHGLRHTLYLLLTPVCFALMFKVRNNQNILLSMIMISLQPSLADPIDELFSLDLYAYKSTNSFHFYTTNSSEIAIGYDIGFGIIGHLAKIGQHEKGLPLYRMHHSFGPSAVDHFLTTTVQERDDAVAGGYILDGVIGDCFVYPNDVAGVTLVPLIRYSGTNLDHCYTTPVFGLCGDSIYQLEGIQCYVRQYTTSAPTSATVQPTAQTPTPSQAPTSAAPSKAPSFNPSDFPSKYPTIQPSRVPSVHPSMHPSHNPSVHPSMYPSHNPAPNPSVHPSMRPTHNPSAHPSMYPSHYQTLNPSVHPMSHYPTLNPSVHPGMHPHYNPTELPSHYPTLNPSVHPITHPSHNPSMYPTLNPSAHPSMYPSHYPTLNPSTHPSMHPSHNPTVHPSMYPSHYPTLNPSTHPSMHPSHNPTVHPSMYPSHYQTLNPSVHPSMHPHYNPTELPSHYPTLHPSAHPSKHVLPTLIPTTMTSTAMPSFIKRQMDADDTLIQTSIVVVGICACLICFFGIMFIIVSLRSKISEERTNLESKYTS